MALLPRIPESVAQHIDDEQAVVGGQQLVEFDILPGGQVVAILQQQPASAFDHAPAVAIGTQFVGPIDPHPVDDLAAVLGHDVEQVEYDDGVPAVRLHRALIAGVHIHDGRAKGLAALHSEQFEDRPDAPRQRPRPTNSTRLRSGSTITVA